MKSERPFPVIETARLRLRKPQQRDIDALLDMSQDDEVMKYYGMSPFKSKAEAVAEMNWFNKIFAQGEGIRWIITEQSEGKFIGDIGFHNFEPAHSRAEIGFKLARAYWQRGFMTEALEKVLEYGFAVMQLNRIQAVVDPKNAACLGTLKKVNFREEGLLRDYEHEPGGFVDLVMLSLLKREYRISSDPS